MMENFTNNLALISIGIVLVMHFAMWLEAILFKHGWQKVFAFTGLLGADVLLLWLLTRHRTLIDIEIAIIATTMMIFWDAKINIKESKDRMANNDNK